MKKTILALVLVLTASEALAQQKTFYDSRGNVVGRSSTDSQGTTSFYDQSGKLTGRASKSGESTTLYDASGRNVGRVTGTR